MAGLKHPVTPDGRCRPWQALAIGRSGHRPCAKSALVHDLVAAHRAIKDAKSVGDSKAEAEAHRAVDRAKQALGERGPIWWEDGAPDLNRQMVKNTPYTTWYAREVQGRCAKARIDAATGIPRPGGVERGPLVVYSIVGNGPWTSSGECEGEAAPCPMGTALARLPMSSVASRRTVRQRTRTILSSIWAHYLPLLMTCAISPRKVSEPDPTAKRYQ